MPDYSNKTDGIIHVEYNHVDQAAEDMRLQTKAIQNTVKALNEELAGLRGAWQGADSVAYQGKQDSWNEASQQLGMVLQRHSGTLNEISDLYRRHENQSADQWANVRIGG
ncbi:WXG100 family type VII secretion target [Streptomyces sp. NPDC014734]|uniref:WXG100 family type VII secretion target n=1 Tax=Streptomyces sp. NPDC014734 TaxID=3364886 RepID=UPI003700B273